MTALTFAKGIVERGEQFADMYSASRKQIAQYGKRFIYDGMTILTHGLRCDELLLSTAKTVNFNRTERILLGQATKLLGDSKRKAFPAAWF